MTLPTELKYRVLVELSQRQEDYDDDFTLVVVKRLCYVP